MWANMYSKERNVPVKYWRSTISKTFPEGGCFKWRCLTVLGRAFCKAWVFGRLLAGWVCGFDSRRQHGTSMSAVSVVCYLTDVSASGWSLVQRSPTECGVSEGNTKALITRRPWPTGCCCTLEKRSAVLTWNMAQYVPWNAVIVVHAIWINAVYIRHLFISFDSHNKPMSFLWT
jgi:hypothetical protein